MLFLKECPNYFTFNSNKYVPGCVDSDMLSIPPVNGG